MSISKRIVLKSLHLLAVVASVGAGVVGQAKVDVTLDLGRTRIHECEPIWASYAVTNRTDADLFVRTATPKFEFERSTDGGWKSVPVGIFFAGPRGLRRVAPGGSVWGEIRLSHCITELEAGAYRVRVWLPPVATAIDGHSRWVEFDVQAHPGNRRLASVPTSEAAGSAWATFLGGSARVGWPDERKLQTVGWGGTVSLVDYERQIAALASRDLSPGLLAELRLEQVFLARLRAHAARLASAEEEARRHAARGLRAIDALTGVVARGPQTGGARGALRESKLDLLSFVNPRDAARERQRIEQEFPLRADLVRAAAR